MRPSALKLNLPSTSLVRARALEAQGRSIIHLEIGEPDFPSPAHVIDAAKRALDEGFTHYGPTQGLPELRASIANYVSNTRHIPVSAAEVCVVPGAKPILFFPISSRCWRCHGPDAGSRNAIERNDSRGA